MISYIADPFIAPPTKCRNWSYSAFTIVAIILILYPRLSWSAETPQKKTPIAPSDSAQIRKSDTNSTKLSSIANNDSAKVDSLKIKNPPGKDTIRYWADNIEYDLETQVIRMIGKGVLKYNALILYADSINFSFDQDLVSASGKPCLVEGKDTLIGQSMVYNFKTRRGKVIYGSSRSEGSVYNGNKLIQSDNKNYYIQDGDYSSCEQIDDPHYFVYGKNIKIIPNDKVISKPLVLNIGGAPIAAMPYFIIPLRNDRRSGWLTPRWGGNPSYGGYMDNIGYYWAPNDYVDLMMSSKVSEFSSYVVNANSNYALRYWLTGNLNARYTYSSDIEKARNEWSLDYNHNQNLLPDESMKLTGRGSIVSSKNFYKLFSDDTTEILNQQINANLSLSKNFKKQNAYTTLTWNRNHDFKSNTIIQDLPSFGFNLSLRPLVPVSPDIVRSQANETEKTQWYNQIFYSYGLNGINRTFAYGTNPGSDSIPLKGYRHSGLSQQLPFNMSVKLFKWINVGPFFSVQHSLFDAYIDTTTLSDTIIKTVTIIDTIKNNDVIIDIVQKDTILKLPRFYHDTTSWNDPDFRISRAQSLSWNTGVNLSTTLYGIFGFHLFSITGIRHTLTPSIGYSYTPKSNMNTDKTFPQIGIPVYHASNTRQQLSFSVSNQFHGRYITKEKNPDQTPLEKKVYLLSSNASISYDLEAKKKPFSDIALSAQIPNDLVDFSYSARFTPYNTNDRLAVPNLLAYSISLNPRINGVQGTLWGGDLLMLPVTPDTTTKPFSTQAGKQKPIWNFSISPHYIFTKSRSSLKTPFVTTREYQLGSSASIQFTDHWSSTWSSRFDFAQNTFVDHYLNFTYNQDCWDLFFSWSPSGYNEGSFYFIIKIKKHPEIKWERRPGER